MERSGTSFRLREVQCLCLILITVVGIKVEVDDDLHRSIRERLKDIPLKECVSDRLDGFKIELIGKVSSDGIGVW